MTFNIFHQVGHNSNWSFQSFQDDKCGDGLILSPVHQEPSSVEKLSNEIRTASMFDPQFYLPGSQKRKLRDYAFFPETIAKGFNTTSFTASAKEAAKQCIAFQTEQGFRNIVIPTRFLDQMHTDFIERLEAFSVEPFLSSIGNSDRPVCLTLTLTSHMILDEPFRKRILNWITSYPRIDQIYLIYCHERETKQIQSSEFLRAAIKFANEIIVSGLELIIGYQNTESLLFSILDGITLTYGNFENTRIFSIDKFLVTDEERRGPKPRIYLRGLLNWVRFEDAKLIRTSAPDVWAKIYQPTPYAEAVFNLPVDPHFNQPNLYKHHILCMSSHCTQLNTMSAKDRGDALIKDIQRANEHYQQLEESGFLLDKHGDGKHLQPWSVALNGAIKDVF